MSEMSPEAVQPEHLLDLDAAIADLLACELGITGPCLSSECDC